MIELLRSTDSFGPTIRVHVGLLSDSHLDARTRQCLGRRCVLRLLREQRYYETHQRPGYERKNALACVVLN